jgi:hypothetical protein
MMQCSLLSLGCVFGFAPPPNQLNLTALRALKIAQRRLRPEVRAKLLNVSSARSNGNFTPAAWRFTFLDPITNGNRRVVTVAARTSSEHPDTVEAFGSPKTENEDSSHVITQNKLLIDSYQALEKARSTIKLKGVHSAEYQIVQRKGDQEPFWNIGFYAEREEPQFVVRVGAKTGEAKLVEKEARGLLEPALG